MKNYNQFLEGIRWYQDGKFLPEEESNDNEHNDFITDDKFRQFLIDNNCYDKYIKNFTKHKTGQDLEEIFRKIARDEYIYSSDAFLWESTPEGYEYWFDMSYNWVNVM